MEISATKRKYIVYNQEHKVLVFEKKDKRGSRFFFPCLRSKNAEMLDDGDVFLFHTTDDSEHILGLISILDATYISSVKSSINLLETHNNKLRKKCVVNETTYYTKYETFSNEHYERIIQLCNTYHATAHMLTLDELRSACLAKKIFIDENLPEQLDILERKLSFDLY